MTQNSTFATPDRKPFEKPENFIVADEKRFEKIIKSMQKDGSAKFHVLADFDRTFTKAVVNGKPVSSLISILRDENYLTPDYPEKAKALFNHYHSIEKDLSLPLEQRKKAMEEWWRSHFKLLIASGLAKKDVERAVESQRLELREGAKEFFEMLAQKNIPLVIMSSSGLGVEAITLSLKKKSVSTDNIAIVSNAFEWDQDERARAVKEPIIHGLSKTETTLEHLLEYAELVKRPNVLLLGDSVDDVGMVEGFPAKHVLKIGFYNDADEKNLEHYRAAFDGIVTGDGTMEEANRVVKLII